MRRVEVHSHQQNLCFFVTAVDLLFSFLFGDDWHCRRIRKGFTCELEEIKNGTVLSGYQGQIFPANWPKTSVISFRAGTDFLTFYDVRVFAQEVHPYLDFAVFDVSFYSSTEAAIVFKGNGTLGLNVDDTLAYLEGQCFVISANSLRVIRANWEEDEQLLNRKVADFPIPRNVKNLCDVFGIVTLRDLVQRNEEDLQRCCGLGKLSLRRIKTILAAYGLKLGMKFPTIS